MDRARERGTKPVTWVRRLEIVRPFATYYCQFEPETAVADARTFGPGHRRLAPHIYTEQEILDLLEEAGCLRPLGGLRPAAYRTLFGLIAAAGLRLSEALHLHVRDVDLLEGMLTVRETKFRKSRLLPLHPSTIEALRTYSHMREKTVPPEADPPFFSSPTGKALPPRTVHNVFAGLRTRLGWIARGDHPNPRIHDLRHTFAVRRVQFWHQSGVPLDQGTFWPHDAVAVTCSISVARLVNSLIYYLEAVSAAAC